MCHDKKYSAQTKIYKSIPNDVVIKYLTSLTRKPVKVAFGFSRAVKTLSKKLVNSGPKTFPSVSRELFPKIPQIWGKIRQIQDV